jgi:hypothetical protein
LPIGNSICGGNKLTQEAVFETIAMPLYLKIFLYKIWSSVFSLFLIYATKVGLIDFNANTDRALGVVRYRIYLKAGFLYTSAKKSAFT